MRRCRRRAVGLLDFLYSSHRHSRGLVPALSRIFRDTLNMRSSGRRGALIGYPLSTPARPERRRRFLPLAQWCRWTRFLFRTYAWLSSSPPLPGRSRPQVGRNPLGGISVLYHAHVHYIGSSYTYRRHDPARLLGVERWTGRAATPPMTWVTRPGVRFAASRALTFPVCSQDRCWSASDDGWYLNPVIWRDRRSSREFLGLQFGTSRGWPFGAAVSMVLIIR